MNPRNYLFTFFLFFLSTITYSQIVTSPISNPVSSPVKNPVGVEEESESEVPAAEAWEPNDLDNLTVWYPATVDSTSSWGTPEYQLTNSGTGPDAQLTTGGGIDFTNAYSEYVDTGIPFNATSAYEILLLCEPSGGATDRHFIDGRDGNADGVYLRGHGTNKLVFFHNGSFRTTGVDLGSYAKVYIYVKWDGATLTVSVYETSGTLIETQTVSASGAISTTTNMLIGANSYSLGNYFNGEVDLAIVRTNNSTFDLLDVIETPNLSDATISELDGLDFYYRFDDDEYDSLDTVTDLSRGGNNGTFYTSTPSNSKVYSEYGYQYAIVGDGKLDFNYGNNGGATIGNVGNTRTISFMIRVPDASIDQTLFDLGTPNNITITSSAIACSDFSSIVVDGLGNTITDNVWHHVYMQSSANVNIDNMTIPSGIDCMMVPPVMYSDTLTTDEKQRLTEFLEEKSTTDMFVFFWQSNAEGQGQNEELSDADSTSYVMPLRGIKILSAYTGGLLELAEPGVNMTTAAGNVSDFGPELSTIKDIYTGLNKPIAMAKYAAAGTSFDFDQPVEWNVNTNNSLYDLLFYDGDGSSYLEIADSLLGGKMKIKAVFGTGGEADNGIPNLTYQDDLEDFIAQIRIDWDDPQIKFIFNQLHADLNSDPTYGRSVMSAVTSGDDLAYLVNVDDIALKVDNVHYPSASLIQIGQRYALEYLNSISGTSPYPVLSSPTISASGLNNGTGSVSTDTGSGTLYWVTTTSSTAPSSTQIINGNDHTGSAAYKSGSQAISSTGTQNISFSSLAQDTYYIHYVQVASLTSTVVSSSGVAIGGSLHAYTNGYIVKCQGEGYTPSSGEYLNAINDFIQTLDDDGILDLMDCWYVWAGDGDDNSKTINWVDTANFQGTNGDGITYDNLGLIGGPTNHHFDTNFIPSTDGVNYTQNNATIIADVVTAYTSRAYLVGNATGALNRVENTSNTSHKINSSNTISTAIDFSGTGLMVFDRQSSTNVKGYQNSTTAQTATQTSTGLPTNEVWFLRLGGFTSDAKLTFGGLGASVDSLISELKAARDTFITALNGI